MPIVWLQRYTADLSRFGGNIDRAIASLPDNGALGGQIVVPGEQRITATGNLPSNVEFVGMGSGTSRLIVPAGSSFPVVKIDGKTGSKVMGIGFAKESGAALLPTAMAVSIVGNSQFTEIDDVYADGFPQTVHVAGQEGTVPGTVLHTRINRVKAFRSPANWGLGFDECMYTLCTDCLSEGHWIDGYKVRRDTVYTTFRDCDGLNNGQAVGSPGGDGIDAYAGGNTLRILGGNWNGNKINGVTIKTDTLTATDQSIYGYVHKGGIRDSIANGNGASGFGVYSYYSGGTNESGVAQPVPTPNAEADATTPFAELYSLNGLHAEGNGNYGYMLGCFGLAASNIVAVLNGRHGVYLTARSLYNVFSNPVVMGNSQSSAGTYHGMYIQGKFVSVMGGIVLGVYAPGTKTETEIAALTKYHLSNVYVHANATEVSIERVMEAHSSQAQGIQTWGATVATRQVTHQTGAGLPAAANGGTGVFGGRGSPWLDKDTGLRYLKTGSNPNQPTLGWQQFTMT